MLNRAWRWVGLFVFGFLALDATPSQAAWNNVYQVTCFGCRSQTSSSFFAPTDPCGCPTVTYRQRCYYQPVTTYRMETTLQPVTEYRTSYFYEPVRGYSYTSYYDPCTGCCRRVCTPTCSYRLRSQCNAVQRFVQRCQLVPVTEMRASYYMEPVVSYSAPSCNPCPTQCQNPCPNDCTNQAQSPNISEQLSPLAPTPRPRVDETPNLGNQPELLGPQNIPNKFPNSTDTRTPNRATPNIRMDRTASFAHEGKLQGFVVESDRITPRGGSELLFVSAKKNGPQQSIRTDGSGHFDVVLTSGEWLMYVQDSKGKPVFHSRLQVNSNDARTVTVVSR